MLTIKLAIRTLLRRKGRMALIGSLVAFGTFLIVFGGTFAVSAEQASREAIIGSFTGDFIVYSARSKDLPSPFAFTTPLPNIRNIDEVTRALEEMPELETYTSYAQNYGLIQVSRKGETMDLPFIFYAVEPGPYRSVFGNVEVREGSWFGMGEADSPSDASPGARPGNGVGDAGSADGAPQRSAVGAEPAGRGVLVSRFQNEQYLKNYGVELRAGESLTVLGVTEGGVNAVRSRLAGIFEPIRYTSVFDYINFMDAGTYGELYNFTGVSGLPESLTSGLDAALEDEDSIFDLGAQEGFGSIDLESLDEEALSGFTMIAVKLTDHDSVDRVMAALESRSELGIRTARWDKASGFYAQISSALQGFIFLAVGLIFLVVTLIFMNTLIINVVERTAEIGTMRAIGAEKSFVRGLFLTETLLLNITSAVVAMAAAGVAIAVFSRGGVPLPETISQFLIGGGGLVLRPGLAPFLIAPAVVAVVSVLATVYPVRVATKITPLAAMSDR